MTAQRPSSAGPSSRPGSAGPRGRTQRRDGFTYFDELQLKAIYMDHSARIGSQIHPRGPGAPVQAADPSLGISTPASVAGGIARSRGMLGGGGPKAASSLYSAGGASWASSSASAAFSCAARC